MSFQQNKKLVIKKIDALYIYHNPLNCFIVYFCICFTWVQILNDVTKGSFGFFNIYIVPAMVAGVLLWGMSIWAKRTVQELNLNNIF